MGLTHTMHNKSTNVKIHINFASDFFIIIWSTRQKRNARAPHSIGFMWYRFLLLEHSVVIY